MGNYHLDSIIFDHSGVISLDQETVYETNRRMIRSLSEGRKEFVDRADWPISGIYNPYDMATRGYGISVPSKTMLYAMYIGFFNSVVKDGIVPEVEENAPRVLEHLKGRGVMLGALSSHPTQKLIEELSDMGIYELFDLVQGQSTDKPRDLMMMGQLLGNPPERTAYLGDMAEDVKAAREAGMVSIWVPGGYHTLERIKKELGEEMPDIMLDSLDGLTNGLFEDSRG